jgi:hypothetical protein
VGTDTFAVGVTVFALLFGRFPFGDVCLGLDVRPRLPTMQCLTRACSPFQPRTKKRLGKTAVQVWNGLHLACPHPYPIPIPTAAMPMLPAGALARHDAPAAAVGRAPPARAARGQEVCPARQPASQPASQPGRRASVHCPLPWLPTHAHRPPPQARQGATLHPGQRGINERCRSGDGGMCHGAPHAAPLAVPVAMVTDWCATPTTGPPRRGPPPRM